MTPLGGLDPSWFRTHLASELLPLWIERAPTPSGLFRCRFDRRWKPLGDDSGTLVSQSRLIYNFCRGHELTGEPRYLEAVESGASFLADRFRDRERGGWFWSVKPDGRVVDDRKESYGHAFAIFGLAHAAATTGREDFADAAEEVWEVIRTRFADGRGGIWRRTSRDFVPRDDHKTQNPIMHLFEAMLALGDVPGRERARADALDVAEFVVGRLVRRGDGSLPELYDEEWKELPADRRGWINIGHQFEWAYLLSAAAERGLGDGLLEPAGRLLSAGLRLGLDAEESGTFCDAAPDGSLLSRRKGWWEQCEMIRALLHFAALRDRQDLLEPAVKAVRFVRERFLDAEFGGWFATVGPDCDPDAQDKGGAFKVDYHNVGMCVEAIRRLTPEDWKSGSLED